MTENVSDWVRVGSTVVEDDSGVTKEVLSTIVMVSVPISVVVRG